MELLNNKWQQLWESSYTSYYDGMIDQFREELIEELTKRNLPVDKFDLSSNCTYDWECEVKL